VSVQTVGIAGLGLLGRGIATCLLSRGFRVIGYTLPETRDEARRHISHAIDDLVTRGGFPPALREEWSTRYVEAASIADLAPSDFVIESIFEDLDAKQRLFEEIEAVVGATVPIASNTSALPITALQRGRKHRERFIGTHWAEPCHLTRFLEVIRGEQTNDATADAAMDLARRAGKDPCLVRKGRGRLHRESPWLRHVPRSVLAAGERRGRRRDDRPLVQQCDLCVREHRGSIPVDGPDRRARVRRGDEAAVPAAEHRDRSAREDA
jgi:3-hydroxyacyl-CoA dehydrogenase